jgi:hypothetical protein
MIVILEPLHWWRGFPVCHPRAGDPHARTAIWQGCG